jgi:23S rRNA (uracil1939-C5)-methyltransferase
MGESYTFSAETFFQGNRFLVASLIEAALGDSTGETALDLFCGVGLFTVPLSRRFKQVIGVESNDKAVDFAEKNAARINAANARFVRQSVHKFLAGHRLENTDFVLIDPPRAGAEKEVIKNIVRLKPKQISYVSCEPAILARDLRTLADGGYEIESITALDLFPQTHHVETVVRLNRI